MWTLVSRKRLAVSFRQPFHRSTSGLPVLRRGHALEGVAHVVRTTNSTTMAPHYRLPEFSQAPADQHLALEPCAPALSSSPRAASDNSPHLEPVPSAEWFAAGGRARSRAAIRCVACCRGFTRVCMRRRENALGMDVTGKRRAAGSLSRARPARWLARRAGTPRRLLRRLHARPVYEHGGMMDGPPAPGFRSPSISSMRERQRENFFPYAPARKEDGNSSPSATAEVIARGTARS